MTRPTRQTRLCKIRQEPARTRKKRTERMTALRPFLFLYIERSPPIPGRALFRAAVYPLRVRHEHPASNASAPAPTYPSRVQRIRPRVQAILFSSAATIRPRARLRNGARPARGTCCISESPPRTAVRCSCARCRRSSHPSRSTRNSRSSGPYACRRHPSGHR